MTATATKPQTSRTKEEDPLEHVLTATEQMMMRADLAQMRMENEMISAECRMRPRNMKEVRAKLQELLEEFPDFAEEAIYVKPVGQDDNGNQKHARGLSIRAAEALAEVYGYNRVRADVSKIDDFTVKVDATFTDFQSGRIWQDGGIVSKFYTARNKQRVTYSDDRFYNVVVKAEKSKYIREVICRSVNSALKAWFEAACTKAAESLLADEDIKTIVQAWKGRGVTLEHLEAFLGKKSSMGWTNEDKLVLRGVWNALKDNETTLKEAFGIEPTQKAPENKPAANGPVKSSDLTKPQATSDAWSTYVSDLEAAEDVTAARAVYDKWFSPDATVAFAPEQNTEAFNLKEVRCEQILGSRGSRAKQKSGQ